MRIIKFISRQSTDAYFIINGLKQGKYINYNGDSSIHQLHNYVNDLNHGRLIRYIGNDISQTWNYVHGQKHGIAASFHAGKITSKNNYTYDESYGWIVFYNSNGHIYSYISNTNISIDDMHLLKNSNF